MKLKQPEPPWMPVSFKKRDVLAIQQLANGTAGAEDQKHAIKWIVEEAAMYYNQSFFPGGEEGRRNSDFAEGRRHVGEMIVLATKMDVSKMPRSAHADPHEPRD